MGKGRKNNLLKLTAAKVKYIICAKTNNISSKYIAIETKVNIPNGKPRLRTLDEKQRITNGRLTRLAFM